MMPAYLAVRGFGCGLFLLASGVSAQVMLSPVAVTETGLGTFSQENGLVEMINQSGLRTPFVNGTTSFDAYFSPNNKFSQNANATKWESLAAGLPLVGNLDFDLGASHQVSKLAIWNISVKDITVHVAATRRGWQRLRPPGVSRSPKT